MREGLERRDELRRRFYVAEREASVRHPNVHRTPTQWRVLQREEFEILPCLFGATEPREHARAERTPIEWIGGAGE